VSASGTPLQPGANPPWGVRHAWVAGCDPFKGFCVNCTCAAVGKGVMKGADFANSLITSADIKVVDSYLDKVRPAHQCTDQYLLPMTAAAGASCWPEAC
jgi:hypothetical protein